MNGPGPLRPCMGTYFIYKVLNGSFQIWDETSHSWKVLHSSQAPWTGPIQGMDGRWALKLEPDHFKPDMDSFTFEFCPFRLAMELTRRWVDEQRALKLELGTLRADTGPLS